MPLCKPSASVFHYCFHYIIFTSVLYCLLRIWCNNWFKQLYGFLNSCCFTQTTCLRAWNNQNQSIKVTGPLLLPPPTWQSRSWPILKLKQTRKSFLRERIIIFLTSIYGSTTPFAAAEQGEGDARRRPYCACADQIPKGRAKTSVVAAGSKVKFHIIYVQAGLCWYGARCDVISLSVSPSTNTHVNVICI